MDKKAFSSNYFPIEVTTHNLQFHEESPILSISNSGSLFATSGNDNTIRLWTFAFKNTGHKENIYRTASNSSISIELAHELKGFSRPVNCVRFMPTPPSETSVLAACSDGGRVIVYVGEKAHTIRGDDGDDAYDLCWADDGLIVSFSSGRVEVYKMEVVSDTCIEAGKNENSNKEIRVVEEGDRGEERGCNAEINTSDKSSENSHGAKISGDKLATNDEYSENVCTSNKDEHRAENPKEKSKNTTEEDISKQKIEKEGEMKNTSQKSVFVNSQSSNLHYKFILAINQKVHDSTITGVSYNRKYKCIATHSFDRTVKVHLLTDKLVCLAVHDTKIDNSRSLFKRLLFCDDFLFLIHKNNTVCVYSYPFRNVHLHKKIGPLNSPVIKVLKKDDLVVLCTKKAVYVFDNDSLVVCVDNACFMAITDGFIAKNTIFVSSMDGFLCSVRLNGNDVSAD